MARKNNSQNTLESGKIEGLELIEQTCPPEVEDVVKYFLLNRRLKGQVKPIDGNFLVAGFRVQIQPDEEQRQSAEGVNRYHVRITESEPEFTYETVEVVKPVVIQLREQVEEFTSDVEAIDSLMQDEERSASEQSAVIERLKSERETEEDEDRLDAIDSEIDEAQNKIAVHDQNLTKARAVRSEKSGLLLNVSENLAEELNRGEMEVTSKPILVKKQFPLETFVS
jgi:hypothetical protein